VQGPHASTGWQLEYTGCAHGCAAGGPLQNRLQKLHPALLVKIAIIAKIISRFMFRSPIELYRSGEAIAKVTLTQEPRCANANGVFFRNAAFDFSHPNVLIMCYNCLKNADWAKCAGKEKFCGT
jgi:hypothetical protein